jgi:hypothetical protein
MTDLNQQARIELMAACLEDPILFMRVFLPHWFTKKISWAHRGLVALLTRRTDFLLKFGKEQWPEGEAEWTKRDLAKIIKFFVWKADPNSPAIPLFELEEIGPDEYKLHLSVTQFTQVVWPRGFGKTTTINAVNIYKVVYKLRKFLVYVSETATHAEKQIDNIKRELASNQRLISVFGKQKPERTDEEVWRQDFFETTGGVALTGKGRGGQVRGLLHKNSRPDDITVDDVEDKESVSTPEQLKKTKVWFKADVEPALNQITKDGVINMIGTILHRDALIPSIMGDPDWISVVFGALDPDGQPLWPEYMTLADVEKKKASYARLGLLAEFYMEFLSQLKNDDSAKFKGPFKIIFMERTQFVGVAEVIDPAISEEADADFCAFGVTGITAQGTHHVLEATGRRGMSPREQIDMYFDLHFKWNPTHHGVEAIAYQKALIHLLKEEMFRRGKTWGNRAYFEITPITHSGQKGQKRSKIPRVEGILQPRYAAGYITHQKVFPELEIQLLEWPNNKLDFPDVIAMCTTLLDPFAALAYSTTEGRDESGNLVVLDSLADDIYEPLEREVMAVP